MFPDKCFKEVVATLRGGCYAGKNNLTMDK